MTVAKKVKQKWTVEKKISLTFILTIILMLITIATNISTYSHKFIGKVNAMQMDVETNTQDIQGVRASKVDIYQYKANTKLVNERLDQLNSKMQSLDHKIEKQSEVLESKIDRIMDYLLKEKG